jgi:hypothetical protein
MTAHCGAGSDTSEFESSDGGLSNSNCDGVPLYAM